ncbi:hypothetical protein V6N13_019783 [Hibiscus sabdariffa]
MKSRSSSLMLPTRAPRKDFADTHNIFATLPTRDPQYGFPHFGCEAAHSAFTGTKSAASLFAIGAVLAFVSEPLLAQVDSELMVSCVGSAFTRDKLFLFLAAYPVLGVNQKANKKLQAIWDPTFDRDEGVVFTRNPRVPDQQVVGVPSGQELLQ